MRLPRYAHASAVTAAATTAAAACIAVVKATEDTLTSCVEEVAQGDVEQNWEDRVDARTVTGRRRGSDTADTKRAFTAAYIDRSIHTILRALTSLTTIATLSAPLLSLIFASSHHTYFNVLSSGYSSLRISHTIRLTVSSQATHGSRATSCVSLSRSGSKEKSPESHELLLQKVLQPLRQGKTERRQCVET